MIPSADPPDDFSDRRLTVDRLLAELRDGRREALDEIFRLVYDELHVLAHRQRGTWNGNDTLNTTALVHEAYLKLVDQRHTSWESEDHFLAAASRAIRHVLINYARDQKAGKRGGGWQQVTLDGQEIAAPKPDAMWEDRVIALDAALARLATMSERQARIVECRFFGGMTVEQTARALGLSTPTVVRGWAMAQAWLRHILDEERGS
jgi:RNA polymerase sigma factor (TIGR02999 family)